LVHDDFIFFMRLQVLPRRKEHPEHIRLDGREGGGSRTEFGAYRHYGVVWKVDEDTRYEPLIFAYNAAVTGEDPFVEVETQTGHGRRLLLNEDLTRRYASRFKYLYIYSS